MSKSENGPARPEDFRSAWQKSSQPERVVLPKSGLAVLLRPPNALRVLMQSRRLGEIGDPVKAPPEQRMEWITIMMGILDDVLVEPKLSLAPGPNEIDPNWLPQEDASFLLNWGLGVVGAGDPAERDGCSPLQAFPGGPRSDAGSSASGGDVELPAERTAGPGPAERDGALRVSEPFGCPGGPPN